MPEDSSLPAGQSEQTEVTSPNIGDAANSSTPDAPKPPKRKRRWFSHMALVKHPTTMLLLTTVGVVVGLVLTAGLLLFLAGYPIFRPTANKAFTDAEAQNLSQEAVEQLTKQSASLGSANQTLTVAATTGFKNNVTIDKNLTAGGTTTVGDLKVTGQFSPTNLNLSSNLTVSGTTLLQRGVTIEDLLTVRGGVNVSGNASIGGSLTAGTITARSTTFNGSLTINGHLQTAGTVPRVVAGSVGAGGTVSISGNDIAGTIVVTTTSPVSGTLATITFASGFASTPRVIISPASATAGDLGYYVTRSTTGFVLGTRNNTGSGTNTYVFDYFVAQ